MNRLILRIIRWFNNLLLNFSARHLFVRTMGRPNGLMVEPYSGCNLKCPLCPTGLNALKRNKVEMNFNEFKKYVGKFIYTLEYITFFNFGEPLLNNELDKFISYCSKYGIATQVSTNGMFLTEEISNRLFAAGLSRLIVSIDTYDEDLYDRYRIQGNYKKVVDNIKAAIKVKSEMNSHTIIVAQYMIMNENEDINKMKMHGASLGVDEVLIKSIGIGTAVEDYSVAIKYLPKNSKLSRYKAGSLKIKDRQQNCKYIYKRMVLCSDGSCLPCCRDQRSDFILGQCDDKTSLKNIWNNKHYINFRKSMRDAGISLEMCERCPEIIKYKLDPWVAKEERKNCELFRL